MSLRPVTDALIEALTLSGLLVGDAVAPDGGGWVGSPGLSDFRPYVVVYPLLGGTMDGPIGDSHADAWPVYQLSSVGGTREQCEWVADRSRAVLLGARPSGPGWRVGHVTLDVLGGVAREDDVQPSTWYCPERFRVAVTPTSH